MATTIAMEGGFADADGRYPVDIGIQYPEQLSRLLIFVKWLLAIPHTIALFFLDVASYFVLIIAWFAILFTGRYPRGLFNFQVGVNRWTLNLFAYTYLLRDEYPPFSMDAGKYPATLDVVYPERLSRLLIFVKWLLIIPHIIVLYFVLLALMCTTFVAWFAILFTGRYPKGLFNFAVNVRRYSERVGSYMLLMTDRYPPFDIAG